MRQKLLFVSHVLPFPGSAGQQLRVRYMLRAATVLFDVDFLTFAAPGNVEEVSLQLAKESCRPVVLKSRNGEKTLQNLIQKLSGALFAARTGLKNSNYRVGMLEFGSERIAGAVDPGVYDCVIYEYFHAVESVSIFKEAGVPVVLDMHNILWRALEQRFEERNGASTLFDRIRLNRYRTREEAAWTRFDGMIAINRREHDYVQQRLQPGHVLFYCPMGIDLDLWSRAWQPVTPPRISYYGGLGSRHNQQSALRCHDRIMPLIWDSFPLAELWIVGSNPSEKIRRLASDPRVKVTGFVENISECLRSMSLILCPWSGTYGFRSRLVEAMALGVPVVASSAAADGMELEHEQGILFGEKDAELVLQSLRLLREPAFSQTQSRLARQTIERLYSLENTYSRLMTELAEWLEARKHGDGRSKMEDRR